MICLDGARSKGVLVDLRHECVFTTQIAWMLWPHLQRDSNTLLRPLLAILQLSYIGYAVGKVVANNVLLFSQ